MLEFDPASFVLTAMGRMNAGTARGDSKLAERYGFKLTKAELEAAIVELEKFRRGEDRLGWDRRSDAALDAEIQRRDADKAHRAALAQACAELQERFHAIVAARQLDAHCGVGSVGDAGSHARTTLHTHGVPL